MKTKLLIFPLNGNGIEALDCLGDEYECIGFIDDTHEKLASPNIFNIKVFNREIIQVYKEAKILAVPGSPVSYKLRNEIINSLKLPSEKFAKVIHPSASLSDYAIIGYNTLIMENSVIKATAKIGNHVCVLPNSVIHHDSIVNDYTLIGANVTIAGYSTIGKNCYIGSGSSIINNITIGDNSLVGMGSNVIRSFSNNSKLAGNPARNI